MLGRLLKHELRATARIFVPVYLAAFSVNLIFLLSRNAGDEYLTVKMVMSIMVGIGYLATLLVWLIMAVGRFYQSMFTDEGYLTHTLPVSTNKLVLSKLLISIFWYLLGAGIFTIFAKYASYYSTDGKFILKISSPYLLLSFISSTQGLLIFSMLLYASLSVAQVFENAGNKLFNAALIVIAASVLYYLFLNGLSGTFPGAFGNPLETIVRAGESQAILQHFLSLRFVIDVGVFGFLYGTTVWCIRHRLNLQS